MVPRNDSSVPALWPSSHCSTRMMSVRIAPRLIAWGLALAAFTLIAGGLVLDRVAAEQHVPESGSLWLYPFLLAAVAAPAVLGAPIVTRHPHNPIGWILVLGAVSLAAVLAATPYAWVALDAHPGSLPGGSWAALVSSLWPVFFAWPLAVAFVFPDGRLPSPRWRPYAVFAASSVTSLVLLLVIADQLEEPFSDVPNPFPLRLPDALGFLRLPVWLAMFASLFVGAAAARVRYKRSQGVERLQLLWLVYAVSLIPLGVVVFLDSFDGNGDAVVGFLLGMEAAVAIAVGVAVTRYRLYEIDRLINRTLVYSRRHRRARSSLRRRFAARGGRSRPRFDLGDGPLSPGGRACLRATAEPGSGCGGLALRPPPLRGDPTGASVRRRCPRGTARAGGDRSRARRSPSRPGAELLFRLPASDAYADRFGACLRTRPTTSAP